ncbi:uncharacterized protein LOC109950566 [Prunus persica]|uniref:uncharacterized protein LOC109949212 n=1 Tax=Prunus persica TaxID=3760 RepID=UPI0009AB44CE|nr:uncharacterized protein LOC109949212 [Prunus persica]XP_020425334.1 uncharacterized protein LOC109950566 [Prunus persica]
MTETLSEKKLTEVMDFNDPYYIHPSDHTGHAIVTRPLEGDNYATWSRAMIMSLEAKNKLGFVDGTIKAPSAKDPKYGAWRRCNQIVKSWILNSISPTLTNTVIFSDTAAEVWADLNERFSQGNFSRIFELKRGIVEHRQQQQSIAVYYTTLKSFWDELGSYNDPPSCNCAGLKQIAEREEQEQILQFLMGLNDTYSAIRGQILLMQPLPNIRKIYSLLLQEEKQRQLADARDGPIHAMNVKKSTKNTENRQPAKSQDNKGKSLYCTHCEGDTHTVDRCYYIIGFPPGHKFHGKAVKPPNRNKRFTANNAHGTTKPTTAENAHQNFPQFTEEEYNQIRALLGKTQFCGNVTGPENDEGDWPGEGA